MVTKKNTLFLVVQNSTIPFFRIHNKLYLQTFSHIRNNFPGKKGRLKLPGRIVSSFGLFRLVGLLCPLLSEDEPLGKSGCQSRFLPLTGGCETRSSKLSAQHRAANNSVLSIRTQGRKPENPLSKFQERCLLFSSLNSEENFQK
jgi:hypothetical protein